MPIGRPAPVDRQPGRNTQAAGQDGGVIGGGAVQAIAAANRWGGRPETVSVRVGQLPPEMISQPGPGRRRLVQ